MLVRKNIGTVERERERESYPLNQQENRIGIIAELKNSLAYLEYKEKIGFR